LEGAIADGNLVGGGLGRRVTSDETAPGLVALMDDFRGVFFVLGLAREGERVFRLAIGNLVDPEPLIGGPD